MAKIVLGKRPKSFKKVVKFPMLDGTTGSIECTYKYRTRKEFSELIDGLAANEQLEVKAEVAELEANPVNPMTQASSKVVDANASYMLDILEAWDVDAELSHERLVQLADEFPQAAMTIMNTYRAACVEGRLGN